MMQTPTAPASHPPRLARALLVLGLTLMLGSCAPFGIAIKNALDARRILEHSLTPGESITTAPLGVATGKAVQIAVVVDVPPAEAAGQVERGPQSPDVRYRLPFEYTVRTPEGTIVHGEQGAVASNEGFRETRAAEDGPNRKLETVESSFEKFDAPPGGQITVTARLQPDQHAPSTVGNPRLVVYDKVSHHTTRVLTGITMIVLGAVTTAIAVILLIVDAGRAMPAPPGTGSTPEARNWAMFCHLSSFFGYVIPFGFVLGPLTIWVIKRNEFPLVDDQGREALNFQISILIYAMLSAILAFVIIGIFLLFGLALFHLVATIIAAVRVNGGEAYRYPLTLRLIPKPANPLAPPGPGQS